MTGFFSKLKEKLTGDESSEILEETEEEGYLELGTESPTEKSKIVVRPFIIENFENIKPILDALRAGDTIALVNIKPLKDKDLIELKRAINKLKKTCDAIDGDIAGFGEDWIAAVPAFAHIQRSSKSAKQEAVSEIKEVEE
ncbi:MAG TPA: cell division protein SepF [Candidatus Nanoarchaeia archaeon]|nr:cell division protein SepF [Candidatus Nanoarchaeia archaeon]